MRCLMNVAFMAERHPEWSFVFIGKPLYDFRLLKRYPNVHFLGFIPLGRDEDRQDDRDPDQGQQDGLLGGNAGRGEGVGVAPELTQGRGQRS